jgi:hypothetical protein
MSVSRELHVRAVSILDFRLTPNASPAYRQAGASRFTVGYSRYALLVLRSPARRDVGGCEKLVAIER